jgi:hypothetical protein
MKVVVAPDIDQDERNAREECQLEDRGPPARCRAWFLAFGALGLIPEHIVDKRPLSIATDTKRWPWHSEGWHSPKED